MISYREWASAPMTERPVTTVVIPTYNEEIRVVPTIGAIAAEMCRIGDPWELIISDDGSTDGTALAAAALAEAEPRVLVEALRRVLAAKCLIRGGFFHDAGITEAVGNAVRRLEAVSQAIEAAAE